MSAGRAAHLYSIAPHAPFLRVLAARVCDGTLLGGFAPDGPFGLADVTIFVPTRRARLALADAFMHETGGAALLPDIRTLGGEHAEEDAFLPPRDAAPLPKPIGLIERRLILSRLVARWAEGPEGRAVLANPPHAAEIFALADSLAEVIDSIAIENADISKLDAAFAEKAEGLAANWLHTRDFLAVALDNWPQIVATRGRAETVDIRNQRLRRQAEAAPALYGDRPVIAAGSTGSIAATAELLAAIADLPRGAVVLPGLDTTLSDVDHAALLKRDEAPHGHPQYGLARLLETLRVAPSHVTELAPAPSSPRTALLRAALARPEDTAGWTTLRQILLPDLDTAIAGISVLAARNADEEARAIALAANQALADGKTVGIVTPDRNLARRIAAELKRFDITVDDAAGTPLFQSAAGRLARQMLALAQGNCAPVDLMALLRNRATTFDLDRAEVARAADILELKLLRGQLLRPGLDGLRRALAANLAGDEKFKRTRLTGEDGADLSRLLDRLEPALAPLDAVLDLASLTAAALAEALAAAVAITAPEPGPGSEVFAQWADELIAAAGEGPAFPPVALESVVARLMAGFEVRTIAPRRDDIVILGQLEARLQGPDLMIICGLNEEVWPPVADPGPWLNRTMRLAMGLEPPERQQGLAAHDFTMAMGNAEVIVAFAARIGTSPAPTSRLVQRLEAFIGADRAKDLRVRGEVWAERARALDDAGQPKAAARPAPQPRADLRPRQLSVTAVEKLFRSPYDIYARSVLHLSRLEPLGQEPGGRERGSLVHDVFAKFVIEGHPFDAAAHALLETMARAQFEGLDAIADRRDIWLKRFSVAARLFVQFEHARGPDVAARHAEEEGLWELPIGFTLTGRADRVDVLADGTLELLDFKTGTLPTPGDMRGFLAPQLLLEAAMAQAVGIGAVPSATVSALTYIKIGQGPAAYRPTPFAPRDDDLAGAIEEAQRRLEGHVDALLLKDNLPMAARVIPDAKQRFRGEFDHLARTDEWLVQEDEDY